MKNPVKMRIRINRRKQVRYLVRGNSIVELKCQRGQINTGALPVAHARLWQYANASRWRPAESAKPTFMQEEEDAIPRVKPNVLLTGYSRCMTHCI